MRLKHPLLLLSLTACATSVASTAAPIALPPIQSVGEPDATMLLGMNSTPSIRVLSGGRVLATDFLSRRLVIVDPAAKSIDTVFDATSPSPLTYPAGFGQLIPGRADTTLFHDAAARGYRVIDPTGRVVRRLPVADQSLLRGIQSPYPGSSVDPQGRLVLATQRGYFDKPVPGLQPQAESLMVGRIAFDRPGWDSLTAIMGTGQRTAMDTSINPPRLAIVMSLVDRGDAWTVTSTGMVAIVRSKDFHVDWIRPDGSRRKSAPIPWTWARYSRAERDSIRAAREALSRSTSTRTMSGSGTIAVNPPRQMFDSVPERLPPFAPSSIRPDLDGRIWLELGPRVTSGPPSSSPVIYAVIDTTGRMVERVALPPRNLIVGFDGAGNVYTVTTLGRDGFAVQRFRYLRP
jgi:hypothetical protein